ncbi:serine hydrolase [Heyndrickxia shackletonii]|uniref:Serine hydrolase n=2 Tax=Heyndrickxia shackletonii TaxID=157838 RepID=A0A0Q3TME2_9BACI|nr:serine hydrolase domain-containing protein [Heyndrickxia shackletonii]KQL54897.1 serine hydrolase [Heyndrickxia shackletonii]
MRKVSIKDIARGQINMFIEERLAKWVDSYERNGYLHGSILVASHGNILLNKGFGMANWEHKVPNKPTTKFRIGSLTKAFTALGIFQLHEKGKLSINDYLDKYFPDFPHHNQITIFHCLTNTSGIPNYTSFPDFWFTTMRLPMTLQQVIDSFKNLELNFVPGSRFEYSNSGYALLTAIIEKVSGMSYGDYILEKICRPLGMYQTGCDDGKKIVPDLASGYTFWEKPVHAAYADLTSPLGAYGLYSTTEDLLLWDQALKSSQILNKELMEKMLTPNLQSYACGWVVSEKMGRKCFHHYGDISGYCSDFFRFVDDEITIIFLSNMNVTPVSHLTNEMAKLMFEEEASLPVPAVPINFTNKKGLEGKYFIEDDRNLLFDISIKDGKLYLTMSKMYGVLYKFKLLPVFSELTKTIFMTEMINEMLIFHTSVTGEIEYVEYTDYYGNKYNLIKGNSIDLK